MLLSLWLFCHDNVPWQFSLGWIFLSGKVEQSIWGNSPAGSREIISLVSVQLCFHMLLKVAGFKLIFPRNLMEKYGADDLSCSLSTDECSRNKSVWAGPAVICFHQGSQSFVPLWAVELPWSCWNTSLQIPKLLMESPGTAQDLEDSSSSFIPVLATHHTFVWAWLQEVRGGPWKQFNCFLLQAVLGR